MKGKFEVLSESHELVSFNRKPVIASNGQIYQIALESYPIVGYAPGSYMNYCNVTKLNFIGDKRAVRSPEFLKEYIKSVEFELNGTGEAIIKSIDFDCAKYGKEDGPETI